MFGSVEPSPAALIRAAFYLFESCHVIQTKKERPKGLSFFGAANRTRTGTKLPSADFKSAVSTYSTIAASGTMIAQLKMRVK